MARGETNVMKVQWFSKTAGERGEYARKEEFVSVFECERVGLQRLALLLTANSETVKRCLIRAFRECIASSSVSKEWVLSWTRRMVIRNAISLVIDPECESFVNSSDDADNGLIEFSQDYSPGAIAESESILDLPELDRFVFVICVLERYSMYDCALLLGRSLRDIHEARQRVGNQVGQIREISDISQCFAMR
jgi:DNA-directed RNA polymerase specialized sigma24 family protein